MGAWSYFIFKMLSLSRKSVGKMRFLFLFQTMFFVSLISNSWAQIVLPLDFQDGNKISPELLCSMPYGNIGIDIYEHTDNSLVINAGDRVYFIAPICLLTQNNTSVSHIGRLTKGLHLGFEVEMWNQDIMNEVADFLTVFYGKNITRGQVHILPVTSMVLVTKTPLTIPSSITPVVPNFYTDHHTSMERQVVDFFVPCLTHVMCSDMAQVIRSTPEIFSNIKFYSTLYQGGKKNIVIGLNDITSSVMMSTLLGKFKNEVYLTENDQSRLIAQTTSNIIEKLGLINSNNIIAYLSALDIYGALNDLLMPSKITATITAENDALWQSVFWDNNYRPDYSSRKLNELYAGQPKEVQDNLYLAFSNINWQLDTSKNVHEASAIWFADRVSNRSTAGGRNITTDELIELHHKSVDHVMWESGKFVPIPVKVTKIDLDKLKNKTEKFQEVKLEISSANVFSSRPILIGHSSSSPKYQARNFSRKSNFDFGSNATQIIQKQVQCYLSHMSLEHSKQKDYFIKQQSKLDEENKKLKQSLNDIENVFQELKRGDKIRKKFDLYLSSLSFHYESSTSSRSTPNTKSNTILKFTNSSLNAGKGFNISTGSFTAPKRGIYHFYFSAQVVRTEGSGANELTINFVHTGRDNWKPSRIEGHSNSGGIEGSFPMQMQATVAMATNDTVHVELLEGSIYAISNAGDTIFGGFIVN